MKTYSLFDIFKAFFKTGAILLGGGYVIIPVLKDELVNKRGWLKDDELYDYYCVSQCLAGITAINTAILAGYKLRKIKGAFTALFAMILPPFATIIMIANLLDKITDIPFIECIFDGVNISVAILIYLALKDVWQKSITDKFTFLWFLFILLLSLLNISPVLLILASIILGCIIQKAKDVKNAKH